MVPVRVPIVPVVAYLPQPGGICPLPRQGTHIHVRRQRSTCSCSRGQDEQRCRSTCHAGRPARPAIGDGGAPGARAAISCDLPGDQSADPYLARLQREAAEKRGAILVVESDGVFAGFASGWIIERDHIPETQDANRFGYLSDICIPRTVRFFETQPATQFARLRRRSVVRFWLSRSATGNSADRSRDFPRMS
jgi:hypothetical protein